MFGFRFSVHNLVKFKDAIFVCASDRHFGGIFTHRMKCVGGEGGGGGKMRVPLRLCRAPGSYEMGCHK